MCRSADILYPSLARFCPIGNLNCWCALTVGRSALLSAHVVQRPDAARYLRHSHDEVVLGKGNLDRADGFGNHQTGAVECSDGKWITHDAALERVEPDSPDIVETAAAGDEIDHPSIRRPPGLVVPTFRT